MRAVSSGVAKTSVLHHCQSPTLTINSIVFVNAVGGVERAGGFKAQQRNLASNDDDPKSQASYETATARTSNDDRAHYTTSQ